MESGENHGQGHAPVGDLLNEQTQQLAAALADRLNPAPTPKNEGASEDVASAGCMDGELEADRDHSPETTVGEGRDEIPATEGEDLEPSETHAPIVDASHTEAADTADGGDDEAAYTGKFSIAPMRPGEFIARRSQLIEWPHHLRLKSRKRGANHDALSITAVDTMSFSAIEVLSAPDDAFYVKNGRAVLEAIDTVNGPDTDVEVRCILFAGTEADAVQEMCDQALSTLDASALEKARALRSLKIVQRIGNVDIAELSAAHAHQDQPHDQRCETGDGAPVAVPDARGAARARGSRSRAANSSAALSKIQAPQPALRRRRPPAGMQRLRWRDCLRASSRGFIIKPLPAANRRQSDEGRDLRALFDRQAGARVDRGPER